ncbi:MAG: aminodeoxychorismate/anthranilate synthase component II [Pseudomonadota bacterium]
MILVIDNYDSFTQNLARYLRLAGTSTRIVRNDTHVFDAALADDVDALVISPGPGRPATAGGCLNLLHRLQQTTKPVPVLGVCLGHQCLVESVGGQTIRSKQPLHGEATAIIHDGTGLFAGLESPTSAGRYHSLVSVLPDTPTGFTSTATCDQGELMAIQHDEWPWYGVQFHPESLLTDDGNVMVENFLKAVADYHA